LPDGTDPSVLSRDGPVLSATTNTYMKMQGKAVDLSRDRPIPCVNGVRLSNYPVRWRGPWTFSMLKVLVSV